MKATRSWIRRFFGALVSLNVTYTVDLASCPYAQTYVPKSGYGVDANAWLARHISQNVTDGMPAVITQLESLQGRVAACADPVEVTDCLLRAVGLDADEREGGLPLIKRKALRSACFAAQFYTHGAIGVCAETMIVGGMFCVPVAARDGENDKKERKNLTEKVRRARQKLAAKELQLRVALLEDRVAELEEELRAQAAA